MLKDKIKKKINLKKNLKKDNSQIRLIFKTHDSGHDIRLPYRR